MGSNSDSKQAFAISPEDTDRHPLFLSSAEYIHPVLNTVPASFPFKNMT